MEIREFAEQVLFATTLEDKLRAPANLTDDHSGPALDAPAEPGRPKELRFKSQGSSAEFPGIHQLEKQQERGRLLHFFANHELLATELMALVLLRFPDAPAAFRRGVLQTLKDEQEHTRLYIERMRECGIHFGDLPVSGYFWRAVSGMENPMDYVAGLSLTFEQANLDFARHFSRGFAEVGDDATASLLEKIYRDEIAHVAYGLKWFRRWKNPSESDWEAFCRQLKFPLSPQRAKGFVLNIAGRRAAGLDEKFITELDVYSQSKGRTPSVFVFNPFAEGYIAHGKAFTPTKHQSQLACDLENLPQFLCRQDDIVLVKQRPATEFLSGIKQAGFPLPEFVELVAVPSLKDRKLATLRPWAWAPDAMELLLPLLGSVTMEPRSASGFFNERIAGLYSKTWSARFLREMLDELPAERWLCTTNEAGEAVNTMDDAVAAIAAIRARGYHKVVLKESLGLAGQNSLRLWEPELLDTQRRWIARVFASGGELVVEPWLERVSDFSVQLEMTPRGLKRIGFTGLINDRKGQFQANWAAPNYARRIPLAITAVFDQRTATGIHDVFDVLCARLEKELERAAFLGPLGIDAFIYRDAEGALRLKPIVEINPRYTMGRLTLELMRHTTPGAFGVFRLVSRAMARGAGSDDFARYNASLSGKFPVRLEGEPVRRIHSGALCLNDPVCAQVVLAIFQVTREMPAIASLDHTRP
jgi:uncharacterized ferritin-like protein (DUF455 family)